MAAAKEVAAALTDSVLCTQQKIPLGLLQMGGVTHLKRTTSHNVHAKCGRFLATNRVVTQTNTIRAVTCQHCAQTIPLHPASISLMFRLPSTLQIMVTYFL